MLTIATICFIFVAVMVKLQDYMEDYGHHIPDWYKSLGGLLTIVGFLCLIGKLGVFLWGILP